MEAKKLIGIVVIVLLIVGVTWLRMSRRADASAQVRADVEQMVKSIDNYAKYEKLLKTWTELAHRKAFDAAYDVGGRRRAASFDADKYIRAFFDDLIRSADQAKKADLVKSLKDLQSRMQAGS
jgi:hypothetical protein